MFFECLLVSLAERVLSATDGVAGLERRYKALRKGPGFVFLDASLGIPVEATEPVLE
jgi:hypothetical protein